MLIFSLNWLLLEKSPCHLNSLWTYKVRAPTCPKCLALTSSRQEHNKLATKHNIPYYKVLILNWHHGLVTISSCRKQPIRGGAPKTKIQQDNSDLGRSTFTFMSLSRGLYYFWFVKKLNRIYIIF